MNLARALGILMAACSGVLAIDVSGCAVNATTSLASTEDGGNGKDTDASSTGEVVRPSPVFLDPSAYAESHRNRPRLPIRRHAKARCDDDEIVGSHWGNHGGPMVTIGAYGSSGKPKVVRWSVPGEATAAAAKTDHALSVATGLPATLYYGADGVVDLPFGPFALLSYSGSGAHFPGEALLYTGDYDQVKSRAKVNGFYSGVGVVAGTTQMIVYSGLSPLSTTTTNGDDCALYGAPVCDGAFAAGSPCPSSWKLFGWKGGSGPSSRNAHGNVFVRASLAKEALPMRSTPLGKTSSQPELRRPRQHLLRSIPKEPRRSRPSRRPKAMRPGGCSEWIRVRERRLRCGLRRARRHRCQRDRDDRFCDRASPRDRRPFPLHGRGGQSLACR